MTNAQEREEGKHQYYKSWVSYQIPMRPVDPIDYLQTESLQSFYLGYFDQSNHLKKFVKYLVDRKPAGTPQLPHQKPPDSIVYFAAIPTNTPALFNLGPEVSYADTEGQLAYFRGVVDKTGDHVQLQIITRPVFFMDEYKYWPNGELQERVITKKDGSVTKARFDKHGKELR